MNIGQTSRGANNGLLGNLLHGGAALAPESPAGFGALTRGGGGGGGVFDQLPRGVSSADRLGGRGGVHGGGSSMGGAAAALNSLLAQGGGAGNGVVRHSGGAANGRLFGSGALGRSGGGGFNLSE
jgi:hypothetical protein